MTGTSRPIAECQYIGYLVVVCEKYKVSKNQLKIAAGTLIGIGLGILLTVFLSSLNPSEKAEAENESWKSPPIPNLAPGQVQIRDVAKSRSHDNFDGSTSIIFGQRDLLIRGLNGVYYS